VNILRIHKEGGVQVELRCSFGGVGILQSEIGVLIPSLQTKEKQETF